VVFEEQTQIIIRSVHDELMPAKRPEQWIDVDTGQWIDQPIPSRGADLNETDLFRIGMQTVSFGVHRDPIRRRHHGKIRRQLFL